MCIAAFLTGLLMPWDVSRYGVTRQFSFSGGSAGLHVSSRFTSTGIAELTITLAHEQRRGLMLMREAWWMDESDLRSTTEAGIDAQEAERMRRLALAELLQDPALGNWRPVMNEPGARVVRRHWLAMVLHGFLFCAPCLLGWHLVERWRQQMPEAARRRALAGGKCPACGYSLKSLRDGHCPECGLEIPEVRVTPCEQ